MRIAIGHVGQQADGPHQRRDLVLISAAVVGKSVHNQRLADDVAHLHARIERPVRVLVNHLHALAQRPHLLLAIASDVLSFELDAAGGGRKHPHDGKTGGRLSASAFANKTERLAARKRQRHAVDRVDRSDFPAKHCAGLHGEMDLQVVHTQQRLGHRSTLQNAGDLML